MSADATRERLIEAGVAIVDATGHRDVGIRAVAAAVGVSHGAPRRHFPTLESLLAAIAATGVADLDARLTPALGRGIGDAAIEYWRFSRERPGMFELIHRHDLLDGAGGRLRQTTGRWFKAVAEAAADPESALAAWSAVHGMCVLASSRVPDAIGVHVDDNVVRRIAERVAAG